MFYVSCCAGANLHADCHVRRHGDLIRLHAEHPDLLFLPADGLRIAAEIERIANEIKAEIQYGL